MNLDHRLWPLLAVAVFHPSWAQGEAEPRSQPTRSASSPSLSETWKGLREKFGSGSKPANDPPASSSASPAEPATTSAPASQSGTSSAIKLKDFKPDSRLPANWNDTHCKNLIEPFGITDSALSLAKIKAEAEGRSLLGRITGTSSRGPDTRAEIRTAARQLNWLPMEVELNLGRRLHRSQADMILGENKSGKEPYARARRILADVLAQVKEPHPYRFQIFVVTASGGNAESGPGGFIYVDQDLVRKATSEPKARFAIAHEVSHVLQRHRTRETQMRLSDGVDSIEDLAKLMASPQMGLESLLKKGLDLKQLFVRHSEEQELQADGCGVRLLDAMSRDRSEVVQAISAFIQGLPARAPPEPKGKATTEAVFTALSDGQYSRHPNTEQRTKNLNAVLADIRAGK